MTDGEKKAIDDLFSLTHINGYINLYDQEKANIYTSNLKRWQNGVKVLLNLMQTQQEEIERLECNNEILQGELDRIGVKTLKLEKGSSTDDVIAEIEKKDKVIDLMSWAMTHTEVPQDEYCICRSMSCEVVGGSRECKNCIKEYFINKVEKESKNDN